MLARSLRTYHLYMDLLELHGEMGRVLAHVVEVQRHQQVRAAQGAAGVAALAAVHHAYDVAAYLGGDGSKFLDGGLARFGRGKGGHAVGGGRAAKVSRCWGITGNVDK